MGNPYPFLLEQIGRCTRYNPPQVQRVNDQDLVLKPEVYDKRLFFH